MKRFISLFKNLLVYLFAWDAIYFLVLLDLSVPGEVIIREANKSTPEGRICTELIFSLFVLVIHALLFVMQTGRDIHKEKVGPHGLGNLWPDFKGVIACDILLYFNPILTLPLLKIGHLKDMKYLLKKKRILGAMGSFLWFVAPVLWLLKLLSLIVFLFYEENSIHSILEIVPKERYCYVFGMLVFALLIWIIIAIIAKKIGIKYLRTLSEQEEYIANYRKRKNGTKSQQYYSRYPERIPSGCRECGGPYPSCKSSCNLYN